MLVGVAVVGCGGAAESTATGESGVGDDGTSGPTGASTGSATGSDESSSGGIGDGTCFQRFGEKQPYDARLVGSDFNDWDGEIVRVVVNSDGWGGEVYAVMETTIQNGAFDLLMPGTLGLDFTSIGIYIDLERDDACSVAEPMWQTNTGILQGHTTREFSADRGQWTQAPCNINGMFDIAVVIPCDG